jgi:hypothetical protein
MASLRERRTKDVQGLKQTACTENCVLKRAPLILACGCWLLNA